MEGQEIRYQIKPKFNILYEMGMPTGSKIRNTAFILFLFLIVTIITCIKGSSLQFASYELFGKVQVKKFLTILCLLADAITIIKLIVNIVFQKMQYDHITYTFYDNMMVYEDDFLNQHRKNIEYNNVKEIEIRRTIWDRLLNYGIMVIYTNADNDRNNGLLIYSIKNPKSHYNIIDGLIHKKAEEPKTKLSSKEEQNFNNIEDVSQKDNNIDNQTEEDFKKSLKDINNE